MNENKNKNCKRKIANVGAEEKERNWNPFTKHFLYVWYLWNTFNNHNFHCLRFVIRRSGFYYTPGESNIKIGERIKFNEINLMRNICWCLFSLPSHCCQSHRQTNRIVMTKIEMRWGVESVCGKVWYAVCVFEQTK